MPRALPVLLLLPGLVWACTEPSNDDGGDPVSEDAGTVSDGGADPDGGEAEPDAGVAPDAAEQDAGVADGGFVPPQYDRWIKFEPEGAQCANGSPYKFFVSFSRTSENVIIYLEGGGACWDYASCTGTGIRSAANRDGIPDDHATAYADLGGLPLPVDVIYPLLNRDGAVSPFSDWNKVFIPYCTGDVYSGDTTVTYQDPNGQEPDVEFHHVGHRNILRTIDELSRMFESIPRMFVGGCSAGGAGAIINYYFFRTGLNVGTGYLLDDSGPIFPDTSTTGWSRPLHDRVRASWNIDPLLQAAPMTDVLSNDLGALADVLALEFPNDRLALTQFRLDYNYSLYSYERFYEVDANGNVVPFGDGQGLGGLGLDETDPVDRAAVYRMWWDDTDLLMQQFAAQPNLGHFIPFYRDTNSSHCTTIPGIEEFTEEELVDVFLNDFPRLAWAGTDLDTPNGTMNVRQYVDRMLDDDAPLMSYFEEEGEGRFLSCTPDPAYYDAAMCAAAE